MKKVLYLISAALVIVSVSFELGYQLKSTQASAKHEAGVVSSGVLPVISAPRLADVEKNVNNERVKAGLTALVPNPLLAQSAQAKCQDMATRNYWAHVSPEGTLPWTFIDQSYGSYTLAGENLAYGWPTAEELVKGWMASPGHRENILKADFKEEGVAICTSNDYQTKGKQFIVVQHFATR